MRFVSDWYKISTVVDLEVPCFSFSVSDWYKISTVVDYKVNLTITKFQTDIKFLLL